MIQNVIIVQHKLFNKLLSESNLNLSVQWLQQKWNILYRFCQNWFKSEKKCSSVQWWIQAKKLGAFWPSLQNNFWKKKNWSKKIFKMNRYHTLQQLGDGTYGTVLLGERVDTGEKVKQISNFEIGQFWTLIKHFIYFKIKWKAKLELQTSNAQLILSFSTWSFRFLKYFF